MDADFAALPADVRAAYVGSHFRDALAQGRVRVYLQPIVHALNQKICGFEALSRWQDDTYGLIAPLYFVPVLEKAGRIHELDLYVLEQVCRSIAELRDRGVADMPISFNISRSDLHECDIVSEIDRIVSAYGIPHKLLHVEITESIFATEESMKSVIGGLRERGYTVWLDDFGSGYSSLNNLTKYDFDLLKLDMGFFGDSSDRARSVIASVISMAKALSVRSLAEGVETREQFEFLRDAGVEKLQGYYFCRPQPCGEWDGGRLWHGLEMETAEEHAYINQIGRVSLVNANPFAGMDARAAHAPLAIVEYEAGGWRYLFANEAFRRGRGDFRYGGDYTEARMTPHDHDAVLDIVREIFDRTAHTDEVVTSVVPGSSYIRLQTRTIARLGGASAILVSAMRLFDTEEGRAQAMIDAAGRCLFRTYDDVLLIDLTEGRVRGLSGQGHISDDLSIPSMPLAEFPSYLEERVAPKDRRTLRDALDPQTIEERIQLAPHHMITLPCHMRAGDGAADGFAQAEVSFFALQHGIVFMCRRIMRP